MGGIHRPRLRLADVRTRAAAADAEALLEVAGGVVGKIDPGLTAVDPTLAFRNFISALETKL